MSATLKPVTWPVTSTASASVGVAAPYAAASSSAS